MADVIGNGSHEVAGSGPDRIPDHLHEHFRAGERDFEANARAPRQLHDADGNRERENAEANGDSDTENLKLDAVR